MGFVLCSEANLSELAHADTPNTTARATAIFVGLRDAKEKKCSMALKDQESSASKRKGWPNELYVERASTT